jgi:hypothetical protein
MDEPLKIPPPDDMSYEAAEWSRLRQGLKMTFDERLEWLEEASEFARRLQKGTGVSVGASANTSTSTNTSAGTGASTITSIRLR